jgi:AcrR family transcriptional regulator
VDPNQLLDAAQAVFAEAGLQAASLRAIARRAGCDPSLIYYHFASKEALFEALLERRFPPVLLDMQQLADAADLRPTALRLWDVLLVFHRHLKDDPGIRAMIQGELVRGVEGLAERIEARIRPVALSIRDIFEQGIARNELRPDLQPLLATFFLVRMQVQIIDLLPIVLPRLMGLDPKPSIEGAMRQWFDLFWRGVALDPNLPLPTLPDPTFSLRTP